MIVHSKRYLLVEFVFLCLLLFALVGIDFAYQSNNFPKSYAVGGTAMIMFASIITAVGFVIDMAVKIFNKVISSAVNG